MIPYFKAPSIRFCSLTLNPWGLLVATGFLVGGYVAGRRARGAGLDAEPLFPAVVWLVVASAVGGHLGHALFYDPVRYYTHPVELLYVWDGVSSAGGILAAVPASMVYFFRRRLPWWGYADCLAYGCAPGWMVGRLGCFLVHDHPGSPTDFVLGVQGICARDVAGAACHDLGLYDALVAGALSVAFIAFGRRPRFMGFFVGALAAGYGGARFLLDFLRTADPHFLGLTPAQYLSVALFAAGLATLWGRRAAPLRF